jgi:6-methylpretetramide 4-monooxygenase / 4-hydroxy-6-methylpretetramide 12a-monooxygenase
MTSSATCDVLVVGAGPVGLAAAHELARYGMSVRLIDAADAPATTSRALGVHARTLEIYDQMGVLDDMLARSRRVEHLTLHQNGRRLIRFDADYSRLPTRHPYSAMIDQTRTEQVLAAAAGRRGVHTEWGTRLVDLTEEGDAVAAELVHADGRTETFRCAWLLGADGGHSTIRKKLGLRLAGDQTETWLIADATVHCDVATDSIHWMRTREGAVMMVPFAEDGRWRLVDTRDTEYPGSTGDRALADRFARKIRAGCGARVDVEPPTWVSVFTIQQRMVPAMRSGRCFVAGDAAHVHSPASGQGLNTGIQEACNLAWKLADVQHGRADVRLLDSYGAERVPVGADLLRSTRFTTRLIQASGPAADAGLRTLFSLVRNIKPLKSRIERKIMGGTSALGVHYSSGSAVAPAGAPLAVAVGERVVRVTGSAEAASEGWRSLLAELREPGWSLLVFPSRDDGPALCRIAEEYKGVVRVRTVQSSGEDDAHDALADPDGLLAAGLGASPGNWLLIRPDGYLAASGRMDTADPATVAGSLGLRPHR